MTPQEWNRLTQWGTAQGHSIDVSAVHRFAGGLANLNFLIQLDGRPAVLRRPPAGAIADGANDMAREWAVLSKLNDAYPLAPKALIYSDDTTVLGVPFQVIEYRPGIAIGSELPAGLGHDASARLEAALIGAMTELHAVDPESVGLGDLGRPEGFLTRQVSSWLRRAETVWPDGVPASVDRLHQALTATVPGEDPPSLLHMDFKLDNILIRPEDLSASAVIDWDMATRGSALFDLAVLLAYWVEPGDPAPVHALKRVPSLEPGFRTRAQLADLYFERAGRAPVSLVWHVTLARLRLAVLWMQLFRLWQNGTVHGDHYAGFEQIAMAILDLAEHQHTEGVL